LIETVHAPSLTLHPLKQITGGIPALYQLRLRVLQNFTSLATGQR